jgi:hypothetical protein
MGGATFPSTVHSEGEVMTIIAIGIDLAKNVFAVHGVDEAGKAVLVRLRVMPCWSWWPSCRGA